MARPRLPQARLAELHLPADPLTLQAADDTKNKPTAVQARADSRRL
jgi:hypothetical protein